MKKLEENLFKLIISVSKFQKKKVFSETCNKLNPSEIKLFEIIKPKTKIKMSELALLANMTKGATSLIVDKLIKKNLMLRSNHLKDRRIVYVSLSKEGEEIYKNYSKCKKKIFGSLAKKFKNFNLDNCNKFIEKLVFELEK